MSKNVCHTSIFPLYTTAANAPSWVLAADSYYGYSALFHQHLAGCSIGGADDVHTAMRNLDFMTGKGVNGIMILTVAINRFYASPNIIEVLPSFCFFIK